MPDPRGRRYLLALLLTVLPLPALAQSDEEKAREQLEKLEQDIKEISEEISEASSRHDELQQQLRQSEIELGTLQREIAENQKALESGAQELVKLEAQRGELELARDKQQARIAQELKTAWQMGRQGEIKVILNQENPHTVARSLGYYRYFFRARNTLLEQYRETLREIEDVQQRIDTTQTELAQRGETLQQQQADLTAAQANRKLAMEELSASISSNSAQLKQKEQDRKQLEDLLRAIEEAVVDLKTPENYASFDSAKGQMPWPITGAPSNQFGRSRNAGKMRWQGVTIPAEEGTTVEAIHHGRVVYADWLRGSGLLLIIDHGDGYMSLYAHNESLLREVGEWVTVGTPISTVGNTGGEDQAALYFEIRHNGKPTNPANWCTN
ncbi:MAG: peptidoglycan DD-metalloendopeptidase family protein [Halioglobus sp.]|jgi:septal ring factor EnvC (AmiA/AmiB activator)|nr:peptidoglycan DD-metalloendopeptidase family protein [Halioglobus sp.]